MVQSERMNKTLIGIIVVVLLGVGGYWAYSNRTSTSGGLPTVQTGGPMSVKDLLTGTGSQRCTFSDAETGTSSTVYVSNGKVRTDVASTTEGQATMMHAIMADKMMYTWVEGQATGMKLEFDPEEVNEAPEVEGESQSTVDLNEKVEYDCDRWSPDSSLFAPPTNIEFSDFSNFMMQETP